MKLTEAFQTAPGQPPPATAPTATAPAPTATPTPTATPRVCPAQALTSFPVQMTQTSTNLNLLYDSVEEPIALEFSWAAKASPPQFEPSTLIAKLMPESGNRSTLRFNGTEYNLFSAQFIKGSHSSWLLPGTPVSQNKEDILLIFETTSDTQVYKYIIFVIPLLRIDLGAKPQFLRGLAGESGALTTDSYNLADVFPSDKNSQYAYYTSCINGYSESAETKNAYVFVAVEGHQVNAALMATILAKYAEAASTFPANPEAPFMSRFARTRSSVGSDFTNFVRTTRYLMDPEGRVAYRRTEAAPTERVIREETLDPYKCVPFDPDTQVEDGKLKIDEETGIPISTILEERTALRADTSSTTGAAAGGIAGGRFGKVFSNVLGYFIVGLLGTVLVALLLFFVRSRRAAVAPSPGAAAVAAAVAATPGPITVAAIGWDTVLSYALLFVFAGFLGFIIGALLT